MKIQVLGSGCPTCKKMYELTKKLVQELESKVELEYLTGIEGTQKMVELGVMSSPVVVVNGKIAIVGYSPNKKTIIQSILKVAQQE